MTRDVRLPTIAGPTDPTPPTVEQARRGLGGRASTGEGAGARVLVIDERTGAIEGVVVYASGAERDVWIGRGRVKRVSVEHCVALDRGEDRTLDAVADDARRFAALAEGARVTYLDRAGRAHAGTLLEKCRYGALVGDAGRVIAVSFRRIAPRTDK